MLCRLFVYVIAFLLCTVSSYGHKLTIPELTYSITNRYNTYSAHFTQGLFLDQGGLLYISSGLYKKSYLTSYLFPDMKKQSHINLGKQYFAEGITIIDDLLYLCTWKSQRCFVYDKSTFTLKNQFSISTEGWGLTHNNNMLILSDGTDKIYYLDRERFKIKKTLDVKMRGIPVMGLNELEYINGYIFANIWNSPTVVLINPDTGAVDYVIDFSDLLLEVKPNIAKGHVLNGIAFNFKSKRLLITGKKWPYIFEIDLQEFH